MNGDEELVNTDFQMDQIEKESIWVYLDKDMRYPTFYIFFSLYLAYILNFINKTESEPYINYGIFNIVIFFILSLIVIPIAWIGNSLSPREQWNRALLGSDFENAKKTTLLILLISAIIIISPLISFDLGISKNLFNGLSVSIPSALIFFIICNLYARYKIHKKSLLDDLKFLFVVIGPLILLHILVVDLEILDNYNSEDSHFVALCSIYIVTALVIGYLFERLDSKNS